jgi:P-type Cu+ transporter
MSAANQASKSLDSIAAVKPKASGLHDPVCKMTVTAQSKHAYTFENHAYYFCSAGCKSKFSARPSSYLASRSTADTTSDQLTQTASPSAVMYTCPMHPEVRVDHPGNCPKCGMALEAELPSLDATDNPELSDFRRRCSGTSCSGLRCACKVGLS